MVAAVAGQGRVLAVFAHPDDEALCAGGTLACCRLLGRPVSVICATRGELGPVSDPALVADAALPVVRERELRESCAQLGVEDVHVLGLPDAGVDWAGREPAVVAELVRLIRSLRPTVILTFGPDGLYGHPDHVAIGEVVTQARALAGDRTQYPEQLGPDCTPHACGRLFYSVITGEDVERALGAMERAGQPSSLWSLSPKDFLATAAEVTARVDVSSVLAAKLRALRSHRTQLDADHLLLRLTPEVAADFLGTECFRCADGKPGDPLSA